MIILLPNLHPSCSLSVDQREPQFLPLRCEDKKKHLRVVLRPNPVSHTTTHLPSVHLRLPKTHLQTHCHRTANTLELKHFCNVAAPTIQLNTHSCLCSLSASQTSCLWSQPCMLGRGWYFFCITVVESLLSWSQTLGLPLSSCVNWDKLFNFSKSQIQMKAS